jgi:hypothetical protein
MTTTEEFFKGYEDSRHIFESLRSAIDKFGPVKLRVTKSQIAFCREKAFAWAWIPGKYLRGDIAPLVLTFVFRSRNASPRWKKIVEPRAGWFTHHLELYRLEDIDGEVIGWLREAWEITQ